jgi:hypothetical protein
MKEPRSDQSEYLVHFTKGQDPFKNIVAILNDKTIRAGKLPWTKLPAVCFTECPWPSLIKHAESYSPYGIGFAKPRVFAAGGGPAYYVRADHFEKQQWEDHVMAFATPFWPEYRSKALYDTKYLKGKTIDYSHEREWRVPHDFSFDYSQVEFVVLNSYEDMAAFPKPLKDAIGRKKFILAEIYQNIEKLWPTHII